MAAWLAFGSLAACDPGEWDKHNAEPVEEVRTELVWEPPAPIDFTPATTATTQIFLWYADGNAPPSSSQVCAGKTPPAFTCSYGANVDECKHKVQAYLDRWYADFNVTFTLKRPSSGVFYTVVISSSGAWCGQGSGVGGVAPINCQDLEGNTCYAFLCGRDAKSCATIIAQEQAHMVGLAHTSSKTDALYPSVQMASDGFEKKDNAVVSNQCRMVQNSYQMMLDRLGAWPGGPKPDPFSDTTPAAGSGGQAGSTGGMAGGLTGGMAGSPTGGMAGMPSGGAGSGGGGAPGTAGTPGSGGSAAHAGGTGGGSGGTNAGGSGGGGGDQGGTGGAAEGNGGTGGNDTPTETPVPAGPERVVQAGCNVTPGSGASDGCRPFAAGALILLAGWHRRRGRSRLRS